MLKLNLSIQQLVLTLPAETKSIRFFGRISTKTKPYYIIEGWSSDDDIDRDTDNNDLMNQEGRNGTNKYTYWVTTTIAAKPSDWTKLPLVTCTQIMQSRQMKRLLSGNLEASVSTYPPFPGVEKHYLRALIADIAGATTISPDGFYELDDSDETGTQIKKSESYAGNSKTPSDLLTSDTWKHHELAPNVLGRITKVPDSTMDDTAAEEGIASKNEIDEEEKNLLDVPVPAPLSDLLPDHWSFRTYKGNKSVVIARNRLWPGSVAVVSGTRYIYIHLHIDRQNYI